MTIDDADSVEHNDDDGGSIDSKQSRRGRLKDALNRTKTKIIKAKEGREAKRHKQEREKANVNANANLDDDVNDFLSAGRSSFASSHRPSIGSDFRPSVETSSASPRPSTSESQSYPSPRRVLPISVPRIDVSASSRFPNAQHVPPDALVQQSGSSAISSGSVPDSSLLKPEYKIRSQSATSIASSDRKARIRGLSVGFADVPPVIIGEGGDEAEAPPVEISRAKNRARSASPQGRRPYTNATVQPEARKQMPARGISDNTADAFVLKPFTRVEPGPPLAGTSSGSALRGPHHNDLLTKPFSRAQTGASFDSSAVRPVAVDGPEADPGSKPLARAQTEASLDGVDLTSAAKAPRNDDFVPKSLERAQTGFSDEYSPHPTHRAPSIPVRQNAQAFMPLQLAGVQAGTMDLTKEFEMTLGLNPPMSNRPATSRSSGNETLIWAPKPKRAPPSYDLIEGGGKRHELNDRSASPPPSHYQQNQQPMLHRGDSGGDRPHQQQDTENVQWKPASQTQSINPQSNIEPPPPKPSGPDAQPQPQKSPQPSIQPPHQRAPPTSTQALPYRSSQTQVQPASQRPTQPNVQSLPMNLRPPQSISQPPAQAFYPPPPQRTATQTARIPQKLNRISPNPSRQADDDQTETGTVRGIMVAPYADAHEKRQLSLDTMNDTDRSFADRQKTHSRDDSYGTPTSARMSPHTTTIPQAVPSNPYHNSPSSYSGSIQSTAQTAQGEPLPNKLRFYESVNRGKVPEGFI